MKPSLAYFALLLKFSDPLGSNPAPNFVLVYVDDLGWAETSVEMIKDVRTPVVIITGPRTWNASPKGAWSFRVLFTVRAVRSFAEQPPARHDPEPSSLHRPFRSGSEEIPRKITIPQALKKANPDYVTAHFGKWHNESINPASAGYDVTDGPNGNPENFCADDGKTHLPDDDPKRIFSLTDKASGSWRIKFRKKALLPPALTTRCTSGTTL